LILKASYSIEEIAKNGFPEENAKRLSDVPPSEVPIIDVPYSQLPAVNSSRLFLLPIGPPFKTSDHELNECAQNGNCHHPFYVIYSSIRNKKLPLEAMAYSTESYKKLNLWKTAT